MIVEYNTTRFKKKFHVNGAINLGLKYFNLFIFVVVGTTDFTSPEALGLVSPLLHLVLVDKPDKHRKWKVRLDWAIL